MTKRGSSLGNIDIDARSFARLRRRSQLGAAEGDESLYLDDNCVDGWGEPRSPPRPGDL